MSSHDVAAALRRAAAVLTARPSSGLHDDVPATARWDGGLRFVASHPNGQSVVSDMPSEMGGEGGHVSPGWVFRAGFAACTATAIAMTAAAEGVELTLLELEASSRSDTRGILGLRDRDGAAAPSGPRCVRMRVRIAAREASAERLRALVETGYARSPAAAAMAAAVEVALQIEIPGA